MNAMTDPFGLDRPPDLKTEHDTESVEPSVATQPGASVLGPTLVFKGELIAGEDLLVQGTIEGRIKHDQRSLTIGTQGKVKADIRGKSITVEGRVEGDMHGSEAVVIQETGKVRGNIFAPRVAIKEGARFKGGIDMDPQPAAVSREPPRTEVPEPEQVSQSNSQPGGTTAHDRQSGQPRRSKAVAK